MTRTRDLTQLEYALLGFVGKGETSAYTVRQVFTDTGMARFSNSPGSIYPALRRLKDQGLLTAKHVAGARGRAKQVFQLSAGGESTLRAWLTRPLSEAEITNQSDVLMLRFSFMEGRCSSTEMCQFVESLRDGLIRQTKELDAKMAAFRDAGAEIDALTLQAGLMTTKAHIRWTKLALDALRAR